MTFNVAYQGAVMRGTGTLYSLRPDGNFAGASIELDGNAVAHTVALTGYLQKSKKGNEHYQTTDGYWIYLPDNWEQVGTIAVMRYSQAQAQALVNKIIANNKIIISNNLLCARYANKLTSTQQAQVRTLQNRLQARNNALQAGGLTENIQTSYPQGFAEFEPYLDKLMSGGGVGIATWAVIVISCVVVAALSTAAYYAYKALADESAQDVKYSKELTAVLTSKLTEAEYQQLLNETQGIVTKSKIKSLVRSYSKWIAAGAVALGVYILTKTVRNE